MTTKTSAPTCGTYGGYQRHLRRHETICTPCQAARAEYQREWRATSSGRQRTLDSSRAQARARERLIQAHPDEYRQHYEAELRAIWADRDPATTAAVPVDAAGEVPTP